MDQLRGEGEVKQMNESGPRVVTAIWNHKSSRLVGVVLCRLHHNYSYMCTCGSRVRALEGYFFETEE